MRDEEKEEGTDRSLYYDLADAWIETKSDFSTGTVADKAASSAKLLGKTIVNTGIFAAKISFRVAKELPHTIDKMQARRAEITEKLQGKTDSELRSIIKSDGFFGASEDEKTIARKILKERTSE